MKKKLLLLIVAFANFLSVTFSQTTVQIGTGTDVPSTSLYGPIYYTSSVGTAGTAARSTMLFTAAELSTAGIPSGATITSIEFYKNSNATFNAPIGLKFYMGNSSNSDLATGTSWSTIMGYMTEVYSNSSYNTTTADGWIQWSVAPFVYTGNSLEIATESVPTSATATGPFQWRYTASVPSNMFIGERATSASQQPPASLTGTSPTFKHRPNIRITFTPPPLSLKLINFFAGSKGQAVDLKWTTADEVNFSHFEVEYSIDGKDFTKAVIIASKQNHHNEYNFVDYNSTDKKVLYYRLKIVDKDGVYRYSKTIVVNREFDYGSILKVYPNPAKDVICVQLNLPVASTATIAIRNLIGGLVMSSVILNLDQGKNTIPLAHFEYLKPGQYLIVAHVDGKSYSTLVMK